MEIYDRYVGLYGKPPEVHPVEEFAKGQTQEFLVRYIYRQHPDYFALKPVVSALFFALFGVGIIVIILGFNKNYILILIGLAILTITNIFYISLSTASRIRAMNAWVGKQIEGANLHS